MTLHCPKHFKTDGQVEQFNKMILERLHYYVPEHQVDWDPFVQPMMYAYSLQVNFWKWMIPLSSGSVIAGQLLECRTRLWYRPICQHHPNPTQFAVAFCKKLPLFECILRNGKPPFSRLLCDNWGEYHDEGTVRHIGTGDRISYVVCCYGYHPCDDIFEPSHRIMQSFNTPCGRHRHCRWESLNRTEMTLNWKVEEEKYSMTEWYLRREPIKQDKKAQFAVRWWKLEFNALAYTHDETDLGFERWLKPSTMSLMLCTLCRQLVGKGYAFSISNDLILTSNYGLRCMVSKMLFWSHCYQFQIRTKTRV